MVLNFHLFLGLIYWVGAFYALYAYHSVLNILMIIPFLILMYISLLWILGSINIFIELYLFIKGEVCEGSIVDYQKKGKKLTPMIRFRKSDTYETYPFYREYFDPVGTKVVTVYFSKHYWTCVELAYLEL